MSQDPDLEAFCADEHAGLFHAITHGTEVWRDDPYDVETIHAEARERFERALRRATTPPGTPAGRILLLLGDSGAGKTHLLRAFRQAVHERQLGLVCYSQMTSRGDDYARYLLAGAIASFEQPYRSSGGGTGLQRLSDALVADPGVVPPALVESLADEDDPARLERLVHKVSNRLYLRGVLDTGNDPELVKALLYLQSSHPRLRTLVTRFLRCEDLSPLDRESLGHIVPALDVAAPDRMLEQIARLLARLDGGALVLCLDQLEDM